MLNRFAVVLLSATVICLPSLSFAQGAIGGFVGFEQITSGSQGITGQPYSAHLITTRVQTLADGTQITHTSKSFQARDSQGRTRNESYLPDDARLGSGANEPIFLTILDSAAGQLIHLDPRQKTATVMAFPPAGHPALHTNAAQHAQFQSQSQVGTGSAVTQSQSPAIRKIPRPEIDKLPGQMINGVYAEGTRTTQIIPAGTAGNNRDITSVNERWFSPDLKIMVLMKSSDPRYGETTTEIKDLSRDEPSPELFQIPEGYKVTSPQNESSQTTVVH